jgi:hypothetical protein
MGLGASGAANGLTSRERSNDMSRLTHVLDSGAEAAEVKRGLWHAVVWREAQAGKDGWRVRVYQPRETDEDLAVGSGLWAPDLESLLESLAGYPYFILDELPWKPGKVPREPLE